MQILYGELLDVILIGAKENEAEEERTPVLPVQYIRNQEQASDLEIKYYPYDEQSMSVSVNGQENFLAEKECVQELFKSIDRWF